MQVTALTQKGLKRKQNQDTVLINNEVVATSKFFQKDFENINMQLIVQICDGMGGLRDGKEASRFFSQCFYNKIKKLEILDKFQILQQIFEANEDLKNTSRKKYGYTCMGTTCAALLYSQDKLWCLNIGDTRIYKRHEEKWIKISKDHLLTSRSKNVLSQCLGVSGKKQIDPHLECIELTKGNFIIASDGTHSQSNS